MPDTLLEPDQTKVNEAIAFISHFSSAVLSTVKQSTQAHTSYAPFITHGDNFYIYVSALAEHSHTLLNGSASLFFIEDEHQAKNIFARTRLTINCKVRKIESSHPNLQRMLDKFERRHGATVKLLRSLPDFILFELVPGSAHFVTGFGAAYDLNDHLPALCVRKPVIKRKNSPKANLKGGDKVPE